MEGTITIKALNDLFKNKSKYYVNEQKGHEGVPESYEGVRGEYNEIFKYYKHPEMPDNLFLRETYQTDSYGEDEHLSSIDFVLGVEKTITVFEPFK